MTVKVLDSGTNLNQITLNFDFVKALTAAQKFVKWLVLTQLKHDVNVFSILEEVLETDDVVMVKGTMNFNLRHKLLLGTGFCEGSLCDDLSSSDPLRFNVSELITLGETSFSKELAAKILLDANISVKLDYFLFDYDLSIVLLILGRLSGCLLLLHLYCCGLNFGRETTVKVVSFAFYVDTII